MITADFHTHTNFSTDADPSSEPERQIRAAIEKGLKTICITDHYDKDYPVRENEREVWEKAGLEPFTIDLTKYFDTMSSLREKYARQIEVRIGIELGLQPWLGEFYKALTEEYPFDFVIGSAHVFDGHDPYYHDNPDETDRELYRKCFTELAEDIRKNDAFDVVGHIDYVVRYGKEQARYYSYQDYREILDEILKAAVRKGKGIELNMAGLKYGLGFAHPHPDILKRYHELGGEIVTVGSDGHKPEHLAYGFDRAGEILKAAGFKYYTAFKNRKPEFLPVV